MDSSSFFIENKALFGSFPTQDKVRLLESEGVRWFINLTDNRSITLMYIVCLIRRRLSCLTYVIENRLIICFFMVYL
jgi:hypothetical protein